jgi:hypothetical protein
MDRAAEVDRDTEPVADPEKREAGGIPGRADRSLGNRGQVHVIVDQDVDAERILDPRASADLGPAGQGVGERQALAGVGGGGLNPDAHDTNAGRVDACRGGRGFECPANVGLG